MTESTSEPKAVDEAGNTHSVEATSPGHTAEVENDLAFLAPAQAAGEMGRLAHYRILRLLGEGGMGLVFLAEDTHLDRKVALKVMKPRYGTNTVARDRFLREAKAAAAVRHDHIVGIHQVGEDRGAPFIALEFLEGSALDKYLAKHPKLPVPVILRIGREIATGLAAAHAKGLIHRDIKPANVWLEAPKGRVKILDFGLARTLADNAHLTQSGMIVGTPAYMAPEQARGEPTDHRCDLFSLGSLLYRVCTGQLPFKGTTTLGVLTALAVDTPAELRSLNPDIPADLESLVARLMQKEAAKRPESAEAVAKALRAIELSLRATTPAGATPTLVAAPVAPAPIKDEPESEIDVSSLAVPAPARKKGRKGLLIGLAAVAMVAVVAVAGVVIIRDKDGKKIAEIEVPKGGTVEAVDDTGKKAVVVGPEGKEPNPTHTGTPVATKPEALSEYDLALAKCKALQANRIYPKAVAAACELVKLRPQDPAAHNELRHCRWLAGDAKGAVAACREAMRLDPDNVNYYLHLGGHLADAGDRKAALVSYRKCLEMDPKFARAYEDMAKVLRAEGDIAGADVAEKTAAELQKK